MKNSVDLMMVMKKMLLGTLFLLFLLQLEAQVVFRKYLSEDHSGKIENTLNLNGQELEYLWKFKEMEKGQFFGEGEAIQRIHFDLKLSQLGPGQAWGDKGEGCVP